MYYSELDSKIEALETQYLGGMSFYEYLRDFANQKLEAMHSTPFEDYKLGRLREMLTDLDIDSIGDDFKRELLNDTINWHLKMINLSE
jgi:hypothetical protein